MSQAETAGGFCEYRCKKEDCLSCNEHYQQLQETADKEHREDHKQIDKWRGAVEKKFLIVYFVSAFGSITGSAASPYLKAILPVPGSVFATDPLNFVLRLFW